jgi:hypothetical protein
MKDRTKPPSKAAARPHPKESPYVTAHPPVTVTSVIKGEIADSGREVWHVNTESGVFALATSVASTRAMDEATEICRAALTRLAKR